MEVQGMETLTLAVGSCCVDYINRIGIVTGVQRQTSSIYWVQLSIFHLKMEAESNPETLYFK
jgi:hypothetical protein